MAEGKPPYSDIHPMRVRVTSTGIHWIDPFAVSGHLHDSLSTTTHLQGTNTMDTSIERVCSEMSGEKY
jgi:hypothetical protein